METDQGKWTNMENPPEDKRTLVKSAKEMDAQPEDKIDSVSAAKEDADTSEVGKPTETTPNESDVKTKGTLRAENEFADTSEVGKPTETTPNECDVKTKEKLRAGNELETKPEDKIDSVSVAKEDADTSEVGKPTETTPNESDVKTKEKLRAENELEAKPEDKIDSVSVAKEDADTSEVGRPTETTPNEWETKPEDKIDSVSVAKEDVGTSEVGKPTETTPNECDVKTKEILRAENELESKPEDKIDSVSVAKKDADTSEVGKPTETTPNEMEAKPEDKIDSVSAAKEDADTSEVGKPTETTPKESDVKTKEKLRAENEFDDATDGRMYPGDGKHKEYILPGHVGYGNPTRATGQRALKILMENCEKCKKSSKENEDLRTKISELETTEKHRKKVIDKMAKENEKNQSNLVTMNKKHSELAQAMAQKDIANQEQIQCLTDKLSRQTKRNKEELKRRDEEIKKKDEIAKKTINWLKNENDDLNTEHAKQIGKFKKTVKEQNDTINSCKNKMHEDSLKFKRLSYQHESILSQMQKLQEDYRVLNGEKQDLLLRLSKVAGANLTYNNPNIADLSDENRPTKLAEEFSELYDNEWTDAFEVLPFEEDEQKTKYMINILEEASRLCSDLSNGHDKRIKDSLCILTAKVYINRRDRKLSCEEKDENLTQSDMAAVTPFEPPEVEDGEINKDKEENIDVINKENNEKGDLEAGKSSNENEGNAVKPSEVADGETNKDKEGNRHVINKENDEKGNLEAGISSNENEENAVKSPEVEDGEINKDRGENTDVINKENDEKGDLEAGISSNENEENAVKPPEVEDGEINKDRGENTDVINECEVEHCFKNPEADKIKKVNSVVSVKNNDEKGDFEENGGNVAKNMRCLQKDNDKQGDLEARTSSNESKGNVAKNDNDENGYFEEGTRSIENGGNVAKESEVGHSDKDTESDTNNPDVSKKDNFEAETSFNEHVENAIKETEVVHGDRDTQSDRNKDGISDESKEPEVEQSDKNTESERNKDGSSDVTKKENDEEVDTNQYDENTIEISIESDFDLLSKEQKKTIMEAKNFFEIQLTNEVETTVTDLISKSLQMKMESRDLLEIYIKKCVNICWSMCRHNPPVFIEFPDVKENIPFDTNKYKPYTRSGKFIDHIVWPALHLHEEGPLLCKGVAQGIGKKDRNKLCK